MGATNKVAVGGTLRQVVVIFQEDGAPREVGVDQEDGSGAQTQLLSGLPLSGTVLLPNRMKQPVDEGVGETKKKIKNNGTDNKLNRYINAFMMRFIGFQKTRYLFSDNPLFVP